MGFPIGMGIPWESHGNGNKTQKWEWETRSMRMGITCTPMGMHSNGNIVGFGGGSDCANMRSGVATTVVGGWKVSLALSISQFFSPAASGAAIYRATGLKMHKITTTTQLNPSISNRGGVELPPRSLSSVYMWNR